MVSSYDFFPTLLDYLGASTESSTERVGRSYAGFLRGESPTWPNELYFEFGYTRAVRTENLKYVERADGWPNELFDLEDDPGESINRVGKPEYRERRLTMQKRLRGFFRCRRRAGPSKTGDRRRSRLFLQILGITAGKTTNGEPVNVRRIAPIPRRRCL